MGRFGERDLRRMEARLDEASALLKAMASPHRLMVLCNLVGTECTVSELQVRLPLSQSALSQHLAVLRHERLVQTRREARSVYYRLVPGPALKLIEQLHEAYCVRE